MSHSGGGPHALACAALLPEQVVAGVIVSSLAPYDAEGLDWFAGMGPGSAASLRAAAQGRAAKQRYEATPSDADPDFIPADFEALAGTWSWFGTVVGPAMATGPDALIDDDLAYVSPWGFDPALATAPLLFLHGGSDRMVPSSHSEWLARRCPSAELRISPDDGHVSVLRLAEGTMGWLDPTM
jgi:pimeloyl-ACP methyl ester carboxylesterase